MNVLEMFLIVCELMSHLMFCHSRIIVKNIEKPPKFRGCKSVRLHLFDQKYSKNSNIVKYYNFK